MEHYWRQISNIHLLTKHYLLIAEEIDERAFIQPLKEHRDAYDHIIRIYGIDFTEKKVANLKQYKESNMKKALGHEYRAFFDTADWLSLICRQKIRILIAGKEQEEIIKVLPEYPEIKEKLINIPLRIAELREKKDIGDTNGMLSEVREYKNILDDLLESYYKIYKVFA